MTDLFNNTSNDYIYPDLPQCAGAADGYTFEFLPGEQVGIVSGSNIIASMGLGDIMQSVTGWVQQTKVLQPGELIFVQGGTKGITKATQYFYITDTSLLTHSRDYMSVDLSINYYNNFRYNLGTTVSATSDFANGIDIEAALNMAFDAKGIKVQATYTDASSLVFTGTQEGYYYDVTIVNSNTFVPNASTFAEVLVEDASLSVPAFKYPNSAMLGYVLKVTYDPALYEYAKWIEINHVPDEITLFTTADGSTYTREVKSVDVGKSGTSCDPTALSAADYLDYIETNSLWEKVGVLRMWLSTSDPANSNIENLITGFYVFNPTTSVVKIDYMTIN